MSCMSDKTGKLITDDGSRLDGRRADEIRPMKIEIGVLSRADGSCYLEWGRNKVLVGVFGPREAHPRRMQRADTAVIRYKYNMASFSVEDRARPGPSRRSIEISKVSREAFEPVIMAELFPKTAIDIFVEVLQADAGTRTAAINASSIALADAGIPMKGLITSCAFGKVDGQIVLDLNKEEDNYGEADFPVAMTQDGEITLLQMDGHLTSEEIKKGLELVRKGCKEILEIQQAVLRRKFETPIEEPAKEISMEEISDIENKVVEAEVSMEYASEAKVVEEIHEEVKFFEEDIPVKIAEEETVTEDIPEFEELKNKIEEPESLVEEKTLKEIIGAEIEEKADLKASLEINPKITEFEELELIEEEYFSSDAEKMAFESEEFAEDKTPLYEQSITEEVTSEKTFESKNELEFKDKSRKKVHAEEAVKVEEKYEKENSKGPWLVVKDPSESGSKGDKDE
jgi:exosome complex component RRP41